MTSYSHDMTFHRENGHGVFSKHLDKLTCICECQNFELRRSGVLVFIK